MSQHRSREVLRLVPGVHLEPVYREQMVDCRLLMLGDRYRQLLRTYGEVTYRLSRQGDLQSVASEVMDSAEIRQYYDVAAADGRVSVTLKDAVFREQAPLVSRDFGLR